MDSWFQAGKGMVSYLMHTVSPQSPVTAVQSEKSRKRKRAHGPPIVLFTTLNQDNGAVCCGTSRGFSIFRCKPFEEIFSSKRIILKCGMFYDKSLLVLLTKSTQSTRSDRGPKRLKVSLFNTKNQSEIWSVHCTTDRRPHQIHFALTRRRLVVTLKENYLSLFDLSASMSPLHPDIAMYDDCGVFDVCNHWAHGVLAFPDPSGKGRIAVVDTFNLQKRIVFQAHDSPIQMLKFNRNGSYIASASYYGTLIRVFSVEKQPNRDLCVATFRRGAFNTDISCLEFNPSSTLLMCSSWYSDTVHIFNVEQAVNSKMKYQSVTNVVAGYLSISSFSCISGREVMENRSAINIEIEAIDQEQNERMSPMQCGFIDDDSVVISTQNGYLYRYALMEGNSALLISEHCILYRSGTDADYPQTKIFKVEQSSTVKERVEDDDNNNNKEEKDSLETAGEGQEDSYFNDDPDQIPSPPESPTLSSVQTEDVMCGDTESWDLNESAEYEMFKSEIV